MWGQDQSTRDQLKDKGLGCLLWGRALIRPDLRQKAATKWRVKILRLGLDFEMGLGRPHRPPGAASAKLVNHSMSLAP